MKREKYKSNKALALFLCAAVLLFSIGLAMARGSGGSEPYKTTDLVLTQGDSGYDLTAGISYDAGKYTLAVSDQGDFDINTPGTYVVGYTLTPITGSAVTALPSKPAESTLNGGQPQEKPSAANTEGTAPAKSDANPSGTDTAAPQTGKPGAAKPDTTNPDAPKLDTSKPDATKPATAKPETTKPATTKPETTKPDATKPATAKPETTKPETIKPGTIKPDTPKPETAKPDEIKPEAAKPDTTKPATTQNAPSKPVATQDSVKPSTSAKAVVVSSLGVSTQQGSLFLSQNLLTGASGCGITEMAPDPLLLADASKSNASKQEDTKAEALKAEPSKGNESATTESPKPSAGDQSGVTESSKPSAGDQSGVTESSKPSAADQSGTTESAKPSAGDQSGTTEPVKPSAGDQSGTTESAKPSAGDQSGTTEPVKPSTGDQPAPTESTKPSIGDQPSTTKPTASTAPESQSQTGMQGAGGSATQPEAQPEQLEPITFTRHVVVTPAVEYQDLRLDVSSAKSDTDEINAALLSGMKFDDKKYAVKVTDDGHFFSDRIGEYQVRYELSDAEDGHVISELQRYVWVTAPGVTFEAQPLTVDTSKDYDLLADIQYNSKKYDLSLVDPNAFDVTRQGPQRVMYRLTLRTDSHQTGPDDQPDQTSQTEEANQAHQPNQTNQFDQTGTTKSTAQAGAENTSPAGVTEPSVTNHEQTGQLVAAVFGREVTVDSGHFIHIDAPPLIVTLGAVQTVNLLEGATATDEKGNPVPLAVVDRSELDKSIKKAEEADPSAAKNPEPPKNGGDSVTPSAVNNQTQSDQTVAAASSVGKNLIQPEKPANAAMPSAEKNSVKGNQPDKTAEEEPQSDEEKAAMAQAMAAVAKLKESPVPLTLMMRSSLPNLGRSSDTNLKKEDGQGSSPANGTANGKTTSSAIDTAGVSGNETTTSSAVDPQGGTTPSDSGENPPVIDLSENVTLPADLPPGIYKILMAAVDPKTGISKQFTREMMLRSGSAPIALLKRIGDGPDSEINQYFSISAAIDAIKGSQWGTAGSPITYTIALTNGNGANGYNFTAGEQKSFTNMGNMNQYTTIVFTGKYGNTKRSLNLKTNNISTLQLPACSDYTTSSHFVFQDIRIDYGSEFYLVANGHQLTMGTAVNLNPSLQQGFNIVGGGKDSTALTSDIKTNVIINSGQKYNNVCGGNWNADTKGSTRVEITDQAGGSQITTLYGGSSGNGSGGNFKMTGNTEVRIGAGTFRNVFGGTQGDMNGSSSIIFSGGTLNDPAGGNTLMYAGSGRNQVGSSSLTITGGTLNGTVFGGSTQSTGDPNGEACNTTVNISGSAVYVNSLNVSGAGQQNGNGVLNLDNGTVTTLYCGSSPDGKGTDTVNINGGTITNKMQGGSGLVLGKTVVSYIMNVNSDQSVNQIQYFDELNLKDGVKLSVNDRMVSYDGGVKVYDGKISFGTNSVLSLENSYNNVAGNLVTRGQGASLELTRESERTKAPLILNTYGSVGVNAAKPLNLTFIGPTADQVNSGDALIQFKRSPIQASDISGYLPVFPRALFLQGDGSTGYIRISHAVSLQDVSVPDNPLVYYGTVAAAMNDIGAGSDYTLTIRKENYALTLNDGIAIATKGGGAGHITFTGGFYITDVDPLASGDKVGEAVRRTVVIGSDPSLQSPGIKPDINFSTDATVKNMKLRYKLPGGSIYANGHKLLVGANVEINSDSSYYPALYGGKKDTPVVSTDVELNSGKFSAIYGGGDESAATVTGDTNITVGGNGELIGPLYGGGRLADVGGNVNLNIKGGKLTGGDPQHPNDIKNKVIGGGQSGNVTGSVSIIINGGTATGPVEVAGCDSGTIGKDVSIDITKGEAEQAIHLPLAHVYGGGLNGGQVMGNATVKLNGGSDYGTVSGGGKPSVDPQTGGVLAPDSSVHGAKNITILGDSVETNNIVNFTNLNLGMAGTAKTTLMIKSSMDSNWGGAADKNDRTGNLNFYEGSVLNLTGSDNSPAGSKNSLAVGNIFTNQETNPTHLHIHKDAAGTYPLYVAGQNTSAAENKIVLGSVGDGQISANGDQLLVFQNKENAIQKQYLSDSSNLDITKNGNIIQYGILDYPKAYLDRVISSEPDTAENVGTGVEKTLSFTFTSVTDGSAQSPVASAYVDERASAQSIWAQTGASSDIPATGTEVKFVRNPDDLPGAPPTWIGTVKLNIKEPDPTTKLPFYFVHVITKNLTYQSFALDVHSPDNLGTTEVNQEGNGDYTLTVKFQDVKKDISAAIANAPWDTGEKKETYTASGLYETAWCVGNVGSPPPAAAVTAALQTPMKQDVPDLHDPTLVNLDDPFAPTEISFHVPGKLLGSIPEEVKKKVVYLFVKDQKGNTRQVTVPMSESLIDVTIPLRAGVIALKGQGDSEVAAPVCYVTNRSRLPVTAEIIKAELDPAAADGLEFVGELDETKLKGNEVNLEITQTPGAEHDGNAFLTRPVVKIDPADPLELGIMAAAGSSPPALTQTNSGSDPALDPGTAATKSYVYFTFDALFNPRAIAYTKDWSVCKLTYKFTMHPGASVVKAGAPNGALSKANGRSPGASTKAHASTSVSSNDSTGSSGSGSPDKASGK